MAKKSTSQLRNFFIVIIAYVALVCYSFQSHAQTTVTCRDTVVHKTKSVTSVVVTQVPYDSTYKVCDTTIVNASTLFNGMYVSGADVKMSDPLKRAILINYALQMNMNFLALYSMGNVWGNATKENYTNTFIKEAHAKGINVGPVISNKNEVMAADAFNKKYSNKFDWMIREKEVWNMAVADQPSGIVTDSLTAVAEKSVSISNALLGYGTYIGWSVQNGRYFKMITVTSSAIFIHVYRTNPLDWAYLKGRITELNTYCKLLGINLPVVTIESYEPGFSQNWAKTNPLSKIDDYMKPLINANSNLHYWGKLAFTDNFLMVSVPYKAPTVSKMAATSTESVGVNYSGDSFINETTIEHRKYLPWLKRLNILNKKSLKIQELPIDTAIYNQTKPID